MNQKLPAVSERRKEVLFREALKNLVTAVLTNDLGRMQSWQEYLIRTVPRELLMRRVAEFFAPPPILLTDVVEDGEKAS